MTQTKIDPEVLISLVENRPIIWDKTTEDYKDKKKRSAAWREVCVILKQDFEEMEEKERQNYKTKTVVKKWNQIRDSWTRSLNAQNKFKKSGSATVNMKKYCYHKQLSFLKKILEPAETHDSAPVEIHDSGSAEIHDSAPAETYDSAPAEIHDSALAETDDSAPAETSANEDVKPEISDNHNEEIEHEPSVENESPTQENPIRGAKRFKNRFEPRQQIHYQMNTRNNSQHEDRNLSFFKSLLPSLALLNDDQILQFQAGVISLLQNIKSRNHTERSYHQQPSTSNYSLAPQAQYRGKPSSPSTSTQSSSHIDDFQPSPAAESSDSDFPDFTLM